MIQKTLCLFNIECKMIVEIEKNVKQRTKLKKELTKKLCPVRLWTKSLVISKRSDITNVQQVVKTKITEKKLIMKIRNKNK